ncbi:COG5001 Predicted signal transduction protein containing a membrane domain, an EAL and a GGDEF domain [Rhabdaerophilaceae bacterium]
MARLSIIGFRTLSMTVIGAAAFVGATLLIGDNARDRILHQRAISEARAWADILVTETPNLVDALAGNAPTPRMLRALDQSREIGSVFRYKLFDSKGIVQYVSTGGKWDDMHARSRGEFSETAATVAITNKPVVEARRGDGIKRPKYFSSAYVPLQLDGTAKGVIEFYLDNAASAASVDRVLFGAATALATITGLAFLLPMLGFFWEERRRLHAAERLAHVSQYDDLTALLNRGAFRHEVEKAVKSQGLFAIHVIDLDQFKDVNDTHGHPIGDILLHEVADRLRETALRQAKIARLGGDEFALLQPLTTDDGSEVARLAQRVVRALSMPFQIAGLDLAIGASVGTAVFPKDGSNADELIKAADLALYAAKRSGRGRMICFEPSLEETRRARYALEARIRQATEAGDFELHFQPLFSTDGKVLRAFEALVRLRDENGEMISPSIFIPIAEELRLIDKIGLWVLREACQTASLWPTGITVAVNLSPLQFDGGKLCATVAEVLSTSGLSPAQLELEVTESILLENAESVLEQLKKLKAMGVSIALDDFGTGYSSLSYLWRFPFDTLKVDGSFMKGLNDPTSRSREVLNTIIALGRVLDLHVTAEGVETSEQINVLRELKCDFVQGFLLGRPIPAIDVAAAIFNTNSLTNAGTLQELKDVA